MISPLFAMATYRLLLEALTRATSYAWMVCNAFYYLWWCLLFVMLLSGGSLKALLSPFKPRKVAGRRNQAAVLAIVVFYALIGASAFSRNSRLILQYLPQTVIFMLVNPFFEELYWRGFLFGRFRERWLASAAHSSIMFGLSHYVALHPLMPHLLSPAALVFITVSGFLWATLYHLSGSLLLPYACHSLADVVGYLTMSGLPVTMA